MLNIFEHPWALLGSAIIVWFVILMLRGTFPNKYYRLLKILTLLIIAAAFGLDFFVATDLEKINSVIKAGLKATEEEKVEVLEALISDNYQDSYHNGKIDLISYCSVLLSEPLVAKNIKTGLEVEISSPNATATLVVLTKFDEQSSIYAYKAYQLTKIRLDLEKARDKSWLITKIEVLEIDRKTVNWKHIK